VRVVKEFQPLVPPRGSVAAHVQAAVPNCRVVAAFHHLPASELGHLEAPIDSDVLICSDDPKATEIVADIVRKIPGCRPLDAGELSNATAIEAFTAVLLQLNIRYKTRVAPKLTGIRNDPRDVQKAAPAPAAPPTVAAVGATPEGPTS
jgi:NADPH-dependent F420 reductase